MSARSPKPGEQESPKYKRALLGPLCLCMECGAITPDPEAHTDWHLRITDIDVCPLCRRMGGEHEPTCLATLAGPHA
jgi:hypothetical protein